MENNNNIKQISANKSDHTTKKIPLKFTSRFVFSDTLTRINKIITTEKNIEKLVMSTQLPYIFSLDSTPLKFNYNLNEGNFHSSYCQISWLIINKNILSPINITFNLTENTLDNTVLVIFEISIVRRDLIQEIFTSKIIAIFPQISVEMLKNLEKELQTNKEGIYQYESKILNYPREKIWNLFIKMHLNLVHSGEFENCNLKTEILKENTLISFYAKKLKANVKVKINKLKHDKNNNKWSIKAESVEGPFLHTDIEWTLIKLGENETLIGCLSKYSKALNSEDRKKIKEGKNSTIEEIEKKLKELENGKGK